MTKVLFQYWGFGLKIASEIEFPELFPFAFADAPDLSIQWGETPEMIYGEDVVAKLNVFIRPTEYLLKMKNLASYYAGNGNAIVVAPFPGADIKSVRLFLLSNAMAAVLYQRDSIPLHASAVYEEDGGVSLFCGNSGAGKSTTVTALSEKGYRVFSDDVCVLTQGSTGEVVKVFSSYPMVKLWADSFEKTGIAMGTEEERIRPLLPKYARFFHEEFDVLPRKVNRVFIIENAGFGQEVLLKKLGPVEGFQLLQRNSYRFLQIDAMGKRHAHFNRMSALAGQVPVYLLSRPQTGNTIEQMVEKIESCFTQA